MHSIITAILILSATGHAERSMETGASIGRIVAQCLGGLANDGIGGNDGRRLSPGVRNAAADVLDSLRLTIDGQPRAGLRSWGEATLRVGAYVADCRDAGSVGYSYRLRIRGYDVRRSTAIEDGRVVLTTDAWWTEVVVIPIPKGLWWLLGKQIIRRIPIHVCIRITATEEAGNTLLVGRATGSADTSEFRCRGVRLRIAAPQATASLNAGLRNALAAIEREGRLAYAGGAEIAGLLDKIHLGIEIGGIIRRRR